MEKFEIGDIIFTQTLNSYYKHYGVWGGDGLIIECVKDGDKVIVREASMDKFALHDYIRKIKFPVSDKEWEKYKNKYRRMKLHGIDPYQPRVILHPIPTGNLLYGIFKGGESYIKSSLGLIEKFPKLYSPEETVSRAKSALGVSDLQLGNHEYFAFWCRLGMLSQDKMGKVFEILTALSLTHIY